MAPRAVIGQSASTRPSAHADVPVVEVDRRVAVAGDQRQPLAEREPRPPSSSKSTPCSSDARWYSTPACARTPGIPLSTREGLEASVDDRAVGDRAAHHGGEDEQRLLELAREALTSPYSASMKQYDPAWTSV